MRVKRPRILPALALLLVALFLGVYFYLESPSATAKLMEEECYLTVAGWLGEQPAGPARPPSASAGLAPGPVVNEAFDQGYYELVARFGGFRAGGSALMDALRAYMDKNMPAPFPELCRKISLRVAKACRRFRSDKHQMGECFSQNIDVFRFGLGRFNRVYLDNPEMRGKVEDTHRELGF